MTFIRKRYFLLLFLLFSLITNAQTEQNPLVLTTSVEKLSETEYNLIFNARILKDWHMYSQYNQT